MINAAYLHSDVYKRQGVHRQTADKTKGPVFRLSLLFYLMSGSSLLSHGETPHYHRQMCIRDRLYALRIKLSNPAEWIVLPEVISKEPLGPVVRRGDDEWLDVYKRQLYRGGCPDDRPRSSGKTLDLSGNPALSGHWGVAAPAAFGRG